MASRISQMRNGQLPSHQPQSRQLPNDVAEQTRALMQQFQMINNKEAAVMELLKNNPQLGSIAAMIRNGSGLESIAKQMAQMKGYDINQVLQQISGGM